MPKLSNIVVKDDTSKKIDDLSIEELESIALGKKNHEAVDAVIKKGDELDRQAMQSESVSAGKKLKRITTQVASLDAAEKAYRESMTKPKGVASVLKKPRSSRTKPK